MYVVGTHKKHLSEALVTLRGGASKEYPQHMLLRRNNKNVPRNIIKYSYLTNTQIIEQNMVKQKYKYHYFDFSNKSILRALYIFDWHSPSSI